jgi:hypothetical protein
MNNSDDKSKDLLKKISSTRIKTAFIFPIAEFEKMFGHLWDPNQENAEVEGPEYYAELFQKFRKLVLDNGNDQIRKMDKDLDDSFEVAFKKHTIYFRGQGNG